MRRGTSLLEAIVFLFIGLIVLSMAACLHARLTRHDTWNASRLSATESLLVAWEHIQLDLACAGPGHVEPGEDGHSLAVERALTARQGQGTESVEFALARGRTFTRGGRAVNAVRLDAMDFAWADEKTSVLAVHLSTGGDRVEKGGVAHLPTELIAQVQVTGRARRAEFASWADEQ